jgi:methylated-DNA-[protein]-cysteine S-methyltransferase
MFDIYIKEINGVSFGVACDDQQIFSISFSLSKEATNYQLINSLPVNIPFQICSKPTKIAKNVIASMKNICDGNDDKKKFNLVNEKISAYALKVLEAVAHIKLGYVASYGNIAKTSGGIPRSVGQVMASNPFPLIIPCHRVICSDFSLGGYSGGNNIKKKLLFREKRGYKKSLKVLFKKKKLEIFPVELVLNKII